MCEDPGGGQELGGARVRGPGESKQVGDGETSQAVAGEVESGMNTSA